MSSAQIPRTRRGTLALASAAALAASLGCTTAIGASPAVRPYIADDAHCHRATPAQIAWLADPAWAAFAPSVRICEVRHGDAPAALLIASAWEQDFYADKPDNTVQVQMPMPLLLALDGRKLGELPQNFPTDAPAELQLRFADWKATLPGEIRMCVITPTPGGNFALAPLRLAATGRYESTGKTPAPSLKDECHGH